MKATVRAPATAARFDALLPPEMARQAEEVGVRKATMDATTTTFTLAVLAGAFIALGGVFATTGWPGPGPPPGAPRGSSPAWRSASASSSS
jgi:formate transporter